MNANASAFVPRQRKVSDDLPDLPEAEDLFELTVEEELEELGMELGGMRSPYNNVEGNEMNGAAMMSGRTPPLMHHHQQQHPPPPVTTTSWSPKEAVNYHHHHHLHHHQSQFQYQNQNQNFDNIDVSNHSNNQGLMGLAMAMGRSYYGSSCMASNGNVVGAPAAENHHVISNGSSTVVETSSSNGHHHQQHSVTQPSDGIQMLQKEFPSYSPESLADILEANDNDVSVTIDVLTQLELDTDYSKTIKLQPVAPALNDINFPELS